jgi:hypothetical protein
MRFTNYDLRFTSYTIQSSTFLFLIPYISFLILLSLTALLLLSIVAPAPNEVGRSHSCAVEILLSNCLNRDLILIFLIHLILTITRSLLTTEN